MADDGAFTCDVNREDNEKVGGVNALGLPESIPLLKVDIHAFVTGEGAYRNVALYTIDREHRRLIFLEVSSLEELWAAPFLDRAVRKHATNRAWAVPFDQAFAWARGQQWLQSKRLLFVWNTGRCGSTLMHRALAAAGCASLSEPWWFDQFTAPWGGLGALDGPDAVELLFACMVIDFHIAERLFPGASSMAINPKAFGFKAAKLCDMAFPAATYDVRYMQLYRDAREVVESFGSIFFAASGPPPRSEALPPGAVSAALGERLRKGEVDTALIPRDDFCKNVAFDWADQFLLWGEQAQRSDLQGRTLVAEFGEFAKDPETREAIMAAVLAFAGLPPGAVERSLPAFGRHSQRGSHMEASSAVTGKLFLDEAAREGIRRWVEHLCGSGPDVRWPGPRPLSAEPGSETAAGEGAARVAPCSELRVPQPHAFDIAASGRPVSGSHA